MSNYRLTTFIITGIALTFGIVLLIFHETSFALLLLALAAIQIVLIIFNWNRSRKLHNKHKRGVR